jgi:hypothetical protein
LDLPVVARHPIDRSVGHILAVGAPANRLLRFALASVAVALTAYVFIRLVEIHALANDFAIPLAATERWLAGGTPYDPASLEVTSGPGLPFLYPPFVLPLLAPLTLLPDVVVLWAWRGICLAAAIFACRRLRIPWPVVPLILLSRPFAEGILAGNIQIVLFAAFVAAFFRPAPGPADMRPVAADLVDPATPALRPSILTAAIGAIKLSQPQPWAYLLAARWRAALAGAAILAGLVALTVPITGLAIWADWLAQVERAVGNGGPAGMALSSYLGLTAGVGLLVASLVAVVLVRRREAGVWVGVLTVIGATSVHAHVFTYLLPAWLTIRREIALIAAIFGASLWDRGVWTAAFIVIGTLVLARWWPALREP